MKGLFKEKIEYVNARFKTREGLFEYLFGSLIWGFLVVRYTDEIYSKILEFLIFLPSFFQMWVGYLVFGLILLPLGIILTYILTKIFRILFKNGKIL